MAVLDFKLAFLKHLNDMPLPDLGDDQTQGSYAFTDAEMATVSFAVSFARSALSSAAPHLDKIRAHYGAQLEKLVVRLREK
jgi:hypothetical protein